MESEVKNPVLRKDLYEKMMKLNPEEPTQEEHEEKAITKLRYMQVHVCACVTRVTCVMCPCCRLTVTSTFPVELESLLQQI